MAEMVTSIRVDEDLWKDAKIYAIKNGMTMKDLIEKLLKKELKKNRL